MGQRLVLTVIYDDGKKQHKIANCYFHWSAYTMSSIEVTNDFIREWETIGSMSVCEIKIPRIKDAVCCTMMRAWPGAKPSCYSDVENFVTTGDSDELELERQKFYRIKMLAEGMVEAASKVFCSGGKEEMNRNAGLIGFTETSIDENLEWAEGDVTIYIDGAGKITNIYFGVMQIYSEEDYFEEEREFGEEAEDDGVEPEAGDTAAIDAKIERSIERTDVNITELDYLMSREEYSKFSDMMCAAGEDAYVIGTKKELVPNIKDRSIIKLIA